MVKKVLLPICATVLIAMLNWGCHQEPIEPTPDIESGGITVEPIVVNGEETGYSLSYRSWIVPGTDAEGNKAPAPPKNVYNDRTTDGKLQAVNTNAPPKSAAGTKGTTANDTVSVILHDEFYHVDTVGYVTTWQPEKYQNGSYTCHWDHYAAPRSPEDYITITDSTSILRIQFEEFSFSYRINFEVATYNNGVINKQMPHYTPVVTDLGLQGEPEVLETICRNDSVFARRVLHHAIRVAVGDKVQTLHAKVTLYRRMPFANPNKFVKKSEILNVTETYVPTDSALVSYPCYNYNIKVKLHYSDGSVETKDYVRPKHVLVHRVNSGNSAPYVPCDDVQGFTYSHMTYDSLRTYFHYNGTEYTAALLFNRGSLPMQQVWDDGYSTIFKEPSTVSIEYSRMRYVCSTYENGMITYIILKVDNQPPQEVYVTFSFFD